MSGAASAALPPGCGVKHIQRDRDAVVRGLFHDGERVQRARGNWRPDALCFLRAVAIKQPAQLNAGFSGKLEHQEGVETLRGAAHPLLDGSV